MPTPLVQENVPWTRHASVQRDNAAMEETVGQTTTVGTTKGQMKDVCPL